MGKIDIYAYLEKKEGGNDGPTAFERWPLLKIINIRLWEC